MSQLGKGELVQETTGPNHTTPSSLTEILILLYLCLISSALDTSHCTMDMFHFLPSWSPPGCSSCFHNGGTCQRGSAPPSSGPPRPFVSPWSHRAKPSGISGCCGFHPLMMRKMFMLSLFQPHQMVPPSPQVLLTNHLSYCLLIFLNDLPVRKRSLLDSDRTQTTDEVNQRGFPTSSHWLPVCWLQTLPSSHWLPPLLWWSGERRSLRWNQRNPLKRSKDLGLCTSSLMRVSTACFSASLIQIESRTWLPVFTPSLPVDMFFSLHVSSYCWAERFDFKIQLGIF